MRIPTQRYVSDGPDCPTGRKYVCIGWLPEKRERVDPVTGKKRMAWAYGCAVFHYGETAKEAEAKLRVWIEGVREAELKRGIRVSHQQRELARKRATAKRDGEIALWGLEETPA